MTQQISQEKLQELIQEELVNVLTEEQLEEFMAGVSAIARKAGQAALQKGSQVAGKVGKAALQKGKALAKQAGNVAKDVVANAGNTYKTAELNKEIEVLAKKRQAVSIKMKQLQQAMMAINADLQMKQDELNALSAEE